MRYCSGQGLKWDGMEWYAGTSSYCLKPYHHFLSDKYHTGVANGQCGPQWLQMQSAIFDFPFHALVTFYTIWLHTCVLPVTSLSDWWWPNAHVTSCWLFNFIYCMFYLTCLLWPPYGIGQAIVFLPCDFYLLMVALWNRADHYIFILSFVLSFFLLLFFLA